MTKDEFKVPVLLSQMEKDSQTVHDLLRQFGLKLKEIEYDRSNNRPPNKYFNLETLR